MSEVQRYSRKVAGSIPVGVIGNFHSSNPFGRIMALGSTRSLRTNQEYLLGGKGAQCLGLTTLPPSCACFLEILGALASWIPEGLHRPVMGWLSFAFYSENHVVNETVF